MNKTLIGKANNYNVNLIIMKQFNSPYIEKSFK